MHRVRYIILLLEASKEKVSLRMMPIEIIMIWSSKNRHPVKRLLPSKNYSQKHLGFYNPKMNGDGDCYKTFQYT